MHMWGHWPDTYESYFCERNGWLSRHWIITTALILVVLTATIVTIGGALR